MLFAVQPNPSWQLSLAQLSPSLYYNNVILWLVLYDGWYSSCWGQNIWLFLPETQQSLGSKFSDCDKLREAVLAGHLVAEVGPGQVGDVGGACLGGPSDPVPGPVLPCQGDTLWVVELPPQPWLVSPQGGQEHLV